MCWVMICWPPTSAAALATWTDCGMWTSVMPHLCCWSLAIQTDNSCNLTVLRPGWSRFRYNWQTVYGVRVHYTWLHVAGVPMMRHRSSIINRLLQNEYRICKKLSLTSLVNTTSHMMSRTSSEWVRKLWPLHVTGSRTQGQSCLVKEYFWKWEQKPLAGRVSDPVIIEFKRPQLD